MHLRGIVFCRAATKGPPPEFDRRKSRLPDTADFGMGFFGRVTKENRRVGALAIGIFIAHQTPCRFTKFLAHQIPQRDVDARKRVVHLELVKAVGPHQIANASDVGGIVKPLTQHRGEHRLAGAV